MPDLDCKKLVEDYLAWLRKGITTAEIRGACEITTPFLDRHNDHIQIYVTQTDVGLRLTDDSSIISDLESSGCGLDTPARKAMLKQILAGFGVQESNDELFVLSTLQDFPRKKHLLIQAMLAVNDMFLTSKRNVTSLFIEDIQKFFEANNVRYFPRVEFTGHSGLVHHFDFAIPKSRDNPERLIKALNQPSRESVVPVLFAWTDTKTVRPPESQAYVILNDAEKEVKADLVTAFQQSGIKTILWSARDHFVPALAR